MLILKSSMPKTTFKFCLNSFNFGEAYILDPKGEEIRVEQEIRWNSHEMIKSLHF